MAAGLGREVAAILGTVLALLILSALLRLERWIDARRRREAVTPAGGDGEHVHQRGAV